MVNKRLAKILLRWTVLIMCIHAIGLVVHYGWPVPMSPDIVFVSNGSPGFKTDMTTSRWFDVLLWPIFALLCFFILRPFFLMVNDRKRWEDWPFIGFAVICLEFIVDTFLFFFCLVSIMATLDQGIVWGITTGIFCGLGTAALMALIGVPFLCVAVLVFSTSMAIFHAVKKIKFPVNTAIGRFLTYMFAVEEEKKEESQ